MKLLLEIFNLLALGALAAIPFLNTKVRGILALAVISVQTFLAFIIAISVFNFGSFEFSYQGSQIIGLIPVRVDYLSAWFIALISFTFLTGAWYGFQYMKNYREQADNIALHIAAFILVYTALINICVVQNGLIFLVFWEIMAVSAFVLVIFENYKTDTLKAGINYLIQSHVSILFIMLGFMLIKMKTGSFNFQAITSFTAGQPAIIGVGLFIIFFIGFAIKAGFVPFHTWLPLAHPAAPAHVSGIMSGVIIKIGIYGMLRLLLLIHADMLAIGYFVLVLSVITGVYGVMLAIVQHNLKKLLAYHSIENIGIIGIGIGLGCLGLGYNNQFLAVAGLGGALLHTLNHSLFKSLLFFTAGSVYRAAHTMNIEALGGLLKKLPRTAYLFLLGSLAICGLPPFNGFVSEFFIYSGLFGALISDHSTLTLVVLFAILGLVLIGGLALICFTKAFGIVFLGNEKPELHTNLDAEKFGSTIPLYAIGGTIVLIGVFPFLLGSSLQKIIGLYQPDFNLNAQSLNSMLQQLTNIGWYSLAFMAAILFFYLVRRTVTAKRRVVADATWGCGFVGKAEKTQYTASSFIRTYRKLAEPVLLIRREKEEAHGLYPNSVQQKTHAFDRIEKWFIDQPIFYFRRFLQRFEFLQNGNIQTYVIYGVVFIALIVLIPYLIDKISLVLNFLNQI